MIPAHVLKRTPELYPHKAAMQVLLIFAELITPITSSSTYKIPEAIEHVPEYAEPGTREHLARVRYVFQFLN